MAVIKHLVGITNVVPVRLKAYLAQPTKVKGVTGLTGPAAQAARYLVPARHYFLLA